MASTASMASMPFNIDNLIQKAHGWYAEAKEEYERLQATTDSQ
jgi:hypothetical protein